MEVVVYDDNIDNINRYFNDYIVDHAQNISFRFYNKKLDVMYSDIVHNKIIGIILNLANGYERVVDIIRRVLCLNSHMGIALFAKDDNTKEIEKLAKAFKSNYVGCFEPANERSNFVNLIGKMKERYIKINNKAGIRFKLYQNFEMFYNGEVINFKSKLAKELLYKLVTLKGTSISKDEMYSHLYPYESVELCKTGDDSLRLKLDNRLRQNWFQLKNDLKKYGLDNIIMRGNDSMRLVMSDSMSCPEWELDDLFNNVLYTIDFSDYDKEDEYNVNNDCVNVLKKSPYFTDFYLKKHNN